MATKTTNKTGAARRTGTAKTTKPAAEKAVKDKVETTVPAAEEPSAKDAEIEALKKQIADMQRQMEAAARPQIVQVSGDTAKVRFLWQAAVADDNVVTFGDGGMYGRIVGKTGTFAVPKSDLSRLLDGQNRHFIDQRWLIVLDGLDEDEREMLGVNYREGEVLDRKAFAKMVDLGNEILDIYPLLCPSHKEMVAKSFNEAYEAGNPKVTREILVALNRMSKQAGSEKGDFAAIIEAMNAGDME